MGNCLNSSQHLILFLVSFLLCAFEPCISEDYCKNDEIKGSSLMSVKCSVQTLNDVFYNFSSIDPDLIGKLNINCDTRNDHTSNNHRLKSDFDNLVNNTFGFLKNLHDLVIENCKLLTITPIAFNGVSQLKNLALRSRNIQNPLSSFKLSAETFSQLQLLENIDLSENNMNILPQTLLCPLRNLQSLNITDNDFADISNVGLSTGTRENVLCLVDVQKVWLSYNRIKVLTNKGFAAASQLKELFLDHNSISRAEELALFGLNELEILDLSSNQIVALPPLVLRHCEDLIELYLQNNSISVLPPGLLTGLQRLRILDLSHNEITNHWLGSDTFSDLIRLELMNLSHNRLTQIDSKIFRTQYSLQKLFIDNNEIEAISDDAFSVLYKLHTLHLHNNRLTFITASTFSGLFVIDMLSLNNNFIENIHIDAFSNNSAIIEINLSDNKLSTVPSAVQSLMLLRSLDLSNNEISYIHSASHRGLENLYSLVLSGNRIGNLTRGVFGHLPNLRVLNLDHNKIASIEQNTFEDVPFLHALRLDSNFLPEVNGLFTNLHDLMMLNISANQIEWFDYALVPIGLQWLDLHDNQIELLGNYFELEAVLKLRTLDASFNHITEIDASSLPNGIEIVYLNHNHIKLIQPFTFMGKPNLTRVDLRRNLLGNIEVNIFRLTEVRNRKPLPKFFISENSFICDCNMEWIQRVTYQDESRHYPRIVDIDYVSCHLTFNRQKSPVLLVKAQSSQFLCQYKNHCFALCHCCEFDACDCEMVCPENCTCFYDQSWNTNIVDCNSQNHLTVPRRIPMDVTELFLDGNVIPSLSSHTFIGRKNMRVLYMNNSNVHVINNRTFNGLKSLQSLYLQNNLISTLHGYEFERLVNLRHLYLSYNRISFVANATFMHLKDLEVLHLDHNFITQFQVWNLNQNLKLADIQLSHNPWACECQFVGDFTNWLQLRTDLVHDVYNVNCIFNDTHSLSLIEYNVTTCTNITDGAPSYRKSLEVNDILPLLILVSSIFVLVIIAIVLFIVFRKPVKVWLFSKFGVRIFDSERRVPDDDKIYDAFISYCKKDEAFVVQVLANELEYGSPHFRLCLHYRDLPIGGYLSEAIIEAIESSRRTILILSENFVRSEWFRYEFKSAHYEMVRTCKQKLIVIFVGCLSQEDLDPDLRLWLKSSTFLHWDDKKFWEKLRFALPDIRNRKYDRCHSIENSISVHI
uniref:Toll family protein LongTollA2 n=1 Tax=Parasteatoda tepidariorum TaxID=114398 RepID=A0A173ADV4_PARTP|nr:toll family protein LongTollA2 [Parasteatoda tepidariorum]